MKQSRSLRASPAARAAAAARVSDPTGRATMSSAPNGSAVDAGIGVGSGVARSGINTIDTDRAGGVGAGRCATSLARCAQLSTRVACPRRARAARTPRSYAPRADRTAACGRAMRAHRPGPPARRARPLPQPRVGRCSRERRQSQQLHVAEREIEIPEPGRRRCIGERAPGEQRALARERHEARRSEQTGVRSPTRIA